MATLTYVYADQMAVLGPLATYAEPHTYDLCAQHAERLTAPRGWEVVRLVTDLTEGDPDDLLAVADAVQGRGPVAQGGRPGALPDPADVAPGEPLQQRLPLGDEPSAGSASDGSPRLRLLRD